MRKNSHNKILKKKLKEQHIRTVTKSYLNKYKMKTKAKSLVKEENGSGLISMLFENIILPSSFFYFFIILLFLRYAITLSDLKVKA